MARRYRVNAPSSGRERGLRACKNRGTFGLNFAAAKLFPIYRYSLQDSKAGLIIETAVFKNLSSEFRLINTTSAAAQGAVVNHGNVGLSGDYRSEVQIGVQINSPECALYAASNPKGIIAILQTSVISRNAVSISVPLPLIFPTRERQTEFAFANSLSNLKL